MASLRFALLDPKNNGYPPEAAGQTAAEVAKKALCGLQTCRTVVAMQQEAVHLLRDFAQKARDIDERMHRALPPNIFSPTGEMIGFLTVFDTFQQVFSTWGNAAQELASALEAESVVPLESLITQLLDEKPKFLARKHDGVSDGAALSELDGAKRSSGTPYSSSKDRPSSGADAQGPKQDESQRVLLARSELQEALAASAAIRERFGDACRPELLLKVQQRVDAAKEHLREAESEARKDASSSRCATRASSLHQKGAPYTIIHGRFGLIDSWEEARLTGLKRVFTGMAKGFQQFQRHTSRWVHHFSDTVERFQPQVDIQLWLEQLVAPGGRKRITGELTEPRETRRGPPSDKGSTLSTGMTPSERSHPGSEATKKTHLDTEGKEPVSAEEEFRDAYGMDRGEAKRGRSSLDDGRRSGGDEGKLLRGDSLCIADRLGQDGSGEPKDGQLSRRVRSPPVSHAESSMEDVLSSLPSVEVVHDGAKDTGPLLTSAEGPSSSRGESRKEPASERSSVEGPSTVAPALTSQKSLCLQLDQYVPDLYTHLTQPIEQCSGADIAEYFLEIQRRFEEYLLALRSLNLSSCARGESWDDPLYYRGPDVEDAFRLFPYKLPAGTLLDPSKARYFMALEWGTPKLDDPQWGYIAYETLLLVYAYLAQYSAKREAEELPIRDIRAAFPAKGGHGRDPVRRENDDGALEGVSPYRRAQPVLPSDKLAHPVDPPQDPGHRGTAAHGKEAGGLPSAAWLHDVVGFNDAFSEDNLAIVRKLVTLMRLKLELAGSTNTLIVELTVPSGGECGRMGQWTSVHPLDVRYRVARLLDAWMIAGHCEGDAKPLRERAAFRDWVLRQIHVVHTVLTFKLWRLARFLPASKPLFQLLNGWPSNGPWYRSIESVLTRFPRELEQTLLVKLNTLLRLFLLAFAILEALGQAAEKQRWGIEDRTQSRDPASVYCTAEWLSRLLGIMNCMVSLDKLVRFHISEDEKGVTKKKRPSPPSSSASSLSSGRGRPPVEPTQDGDHPHRPGGEDSLFSDFMLPVLTHMPQTEPLNLYWSYEVPMVQLIMSYLWRTVVDTSSPDALHANGPTLATGLLLVASVIQLGRDPTQRVGTPAPFPVVTLSTQTHCLLLAQALWTELLSKNRRNYGRLTTDGGAAARLDEEAVEGSDEESHFHVIPTAALRALLRLLDVEGLTAWLVTSAKGHKELGRSTVIKGREVDGYPSSARRLWVSPATVSAKRCECLVLQWFVDPWDSLYLPSSSASGEGPAAAMSEVENPDFFVVDVTELEDLGQRAREDERRRRRLEDLLVAVAETLEEKTSSVVHSTVKQRKAAALAQREDSTPDSLGPEDVLNKEVRKKKRADALLRDLRLSRRKRVGTIELIQSDIDALDFEGPAAMVQDHAGLRPQYLAPIPAQRVPGPVGPLPSPVLPGKPHLDKLHKPDHVFVKSRVRTGYDVLHNSGMMLTTGQHGLLKPLETIREQAEGISLLLPSRIERVMTEVLCNRLLTAPFRTEMADVLGNYRLQLEPDALPLLLQLWTKVNHSLLSAVPSVSPAVPNLSQFNMAYPLPTLLSGPSADYDLYRYFISQTVVRLLSRLFTEARLASTSAVSITEAPADAVKSTVSGDVVKLYGGALKAFVEELRGELQFYPAYWKDLLPLNQHALIVAYTSRKTLVILLHELLHSAHWPDDDIPPYGSEVLRGIRAFELLLREIKIGTHYDLTAADEILDDFKPSVLGGLAKHFKTMEETLERCLSADTWEPVVGQLYSNSVIDLFTFVHHLLSILQDLSAPLEWMIPAFTEFLGRITNIFSTFLLADCANESLVMMQQEIDRIFDTLHKPSARRHGEHEIATETRIKASLKKSTKGGGAAGLLKSVQKLAGFKKKKSPQRERLEPHLNQQHPRLEPVSTTMLNTSLLPAAVGGRDASFFPVTPSKSGAELTVGSDAEGSGQSTPTKKKSSKKKKKGKKGHTEATEHGDIAVIPEASFTRIATRFGIPVVLRFCAIKQWFDRVPLKSCLVRFHNLKVFAEQLNALVTKCRDIARESVKERDPKSSEIVQALNAAAGCPSLSAAGDAQEHELDLCENAAFLEKLEETLTTTAAAYQKSLEKITMELCRLVALRIILYEFGEDFFEELYHPTFGHYSFESILNAFKDTVERFVLKLPEEYQKKLRMVLLQYLVKVWCYLITEMGYHGTVFLPEDMAVLDEDLEVLKTFCEHQFDSSFFITLGTSVTDANVQEPENPRSVQVLDYVNDFFCFLGYKPDALAELGAADLLHKPLSSSKKPGGSPEVMSMGSPRDKSLRSPHIVKQSGDASSVPSHLEGDLSSVFGASQSKTPSRSKPKKKGWLAKLF